MKNLNTKFVEELSNIKDPSIFLGLARVLKVEFVKVEKEETISRDFCEICADVIESYANSDRRRKRELLKILRQANQEGDSDADRTEDTETSVSNEKM